MWNGVKMEVSAVNGTEANRSLEWVSGSVI